MKGVPQLGQNRQFQWFNNPSFIYPMVPASAATLLKHEGYEVIWKDAIVERWSYKKFLGFFEKQNPDLILIQSQENNQKLLERSNFDTIFNLETQYKKDPHHFRGSGFNQILAKLANKNNIIIAFPFSLLLNSEIIKRTKIKNW